MLATRLMVLVPEPVQALGPEGSSCRSLGQDLQKWGIRTLPPGLGLGPALPGAHPNGSAVRLPRLSVPIRYLLRLDVAGVLLVALGELDFGIWMGIVRSPGGLRLTRARMAPSSRSPAPSPSEARSSTGMSDRRHAP